MLECNIYIFLGQTGNWEIVYGNNLLNREKFAIQGSIKIKNNYISGTAKKTLAEQQRKH
jgi:hypothetical protein